MKNWIKGIIAVIVAVAAAVGGLFGWKNYQKSTKEVDVYPMSMMNMQYYDESLTTNGYVYSSDTQAIYYDASQMITEVYVTEGQPVKKGDALMAYDTTTVEIAVEQQRLSVQSLQNEIAKGQRNLTKLRNTKPSAAPTPAPEPEPDPFNPDSPDDPKEDPYAPKQINDAWNRLVDPAAQCYAERPITIETVTEVEQEGDNPVYKVEHERIGTEYHYLVIPEGRIYGSFLNSLALGENDVALIETSPGNTYQYAVPSWRIKKTEWPMLPEEICWDPYGSLAEDLPADFDDYGNIDFPVFDGEEPSFEPSYTAEELKDMIARQEKELKDLDLNLRKAQLELKSRQEQLSDGIVRARNDGVVTVVNSPDAPPQDGSPFLQVSGGQGLFIRGEISELQLDSIEIGQEVYATSWMDGNTYTATVQSIEEWPSNSNNYYGGNPNASYYYFIAYSEESSGLPTGTYLQLSFQDLGGQSVDPNKICVQNAYVRSDAQGKYCMVMENGVLKKRYVTTGKTYYGYAVEIKEGLTLDDYLAFPYGDGAIEGVKAKVNEGGMYY
ncbi:MAG: biotin/lipoyl-binding protein [Solobacterium sp.]|nr:biotin/lipoyl-binding protein [Solobacterium sp.]